MRLTTAKAQSLSKQCKDPPQVPPLGSLSVEDHDFPNSETRKETRKAGKTVVLDKCAGGAFKVSPSTPIHALQNFFFSFLVFLLMVISHL